MHNQLYVKVRGSILMYNHSYYPEKAQFDKQRNLDNPVVMTDSSI